MQEKIPLNLSLGSNQTLLYLSLASFITAAGALFLIFWPGLTTALWISNRFAAFTWSIAALFIGTCVLFIGLKNKDILELVYPVTALYILHFPLRGLFMLLWPEYTNFMYNWPANDEKYVAYALSISLLGMVFFLLGYFLPGFAKLTDHLPKLAWSFPKASLAKIAVLYSLGFTSFLMLFLGGLALRFQWIENRSAVPFYSFFLLFGELRLIAVYLLWARKGETPFDRLLAYGALASEVLIGITIGSKLTIFLAFLAVIFAEHYSKRRRNRVVSIRAIMLVILFLLVMFPLVQTYRDVYRAEFAFHPNPEAGEILGLSGEVANSLLNEINIQNTATAIFNRASQLDSLTMVVYRVPRVIGFARGETLWPTMLIGFIPRILWPSKPTLVLGQFMTKVIIGSPSETNIGMTNVGELYFNFGAWGVPAGMFLLGAFFRFVYVYIHRCVASRVLQGMFYLAVFPSLLLSASGLATIPVGLVRIGIVQLMLVWFLNLGRRKNKPLSPST